MRQRLNQHRETLLALGAALLCLAAAVLVWLAVVRGNGDKSLSEKICDDYAAALPLEDGDTLTQSFTTGNGLLALAFVFDIPGEQPAGTLELTLTDAVTGEVLAQSQGDMAFILPGQYTGLGLDRPVKAQAGRQYQVSLTPHYAGAGRLSVCGSDGAALPGETMTLNGEAVDSTAALLANVRRIGGFLTRFFLLVALAASAVVFFGVRSALLQKMALHRLVFVLVVCFGMLYSLVLPPYAAPDEKYHINQSFTLASQWANRFSPEDWHMQSVQLTRSYRREHDFNAMIQNEKTTVFTWQETVDQLFTTTTDRFDSHVELAEMQADRNYLLSAVSALAVFLCFVLHIGFVPALMLGRLANLLAFAALAALAVKHAPFGKRILAASALLPMTLHLAASFSRDSILLGLCFAFTGLLLEACFSGREVPLWQQAALCAAGGLLASGKAVYLPLALTALCIPAARLGRWANLKKAGYLAVCLAFLAAINAAMLREVLAPAPVEQTAQSEQQDPARQTPEPEPAAPAQDAAPEAIVSVEQSVSTAEDMIRYTPVYILTHIPDTVNLVVRSLVQYTDHYLCSLVGGSLSYFSVELAWGWVLALYLLLFFAAAPAADAPALPAGTARLGLAAAALACCALAVAGCILWTPVSYTTIYGLQGRYFLPVLPVLLLTCLPRGWTVAKRGDAAARLLCGLCVVHAGVLLNIMLVVIAR